MSLVRDALAKAEREAAARAAREKGVPPALAAGAQPYRARARRAPWLAGAAIALVAVAALAVVLLRPAAETPNTVPRTPAEPLQARAEGTPPATERAARVAPEPTPPAPAEVAAPAAPATAAPALPPPPAEPSRVASPALPDASAGATARSVPAAVPQLPASGSYLRELDLGGGRVVRLGGIAWSEAAPNAFLNERLVGVGEYVEGLRVAAVERDHVVLEAAGRRYELRLR